MKDKKQQPKRTCPESGRRKRGAPVGNQNARTHGKYSRVISPREMEVLAAVKSLDDHGRQVIFGALLAYILEHHPEIFDSQLYQPVPENREQMP